MLTSTRSIWAAVILHNILLSDQSPMAFDYKKIEGQSLQIQNVT